MDGNRGQEASEPLPEELMGKIVAMVPFPAIFKARLLSKSWLARFQPISSLHDEEEKLLAAGFQKQVLERSKTWETFYPVCITEEDFFAYNLGSKKWQRLPPLRFLPKELSLAGRNLERDALYKAKKHLYIDGAFVSGTWRSKDEGESRLLNRGIIVANILTQKWRKLPPPPFGDFFTLPVRPTRTGHTIVVTGMKLVCDASSETYKLILSCKEGRKNCPHFAQIYDSKSGTWSRKDFVISVGFSTPPSTFACLEGVHYGLAFNNLQSLAAFNVEDGNMEDRLVPSTMGRLIKEEYTGTTFIVPDFEEFNVVTLMARNGSLLLVLTTWQGNLFVFDIDVESMLWLEVGSCRADDFELVDWHHPEDFKEDMNDIRFTEDNSIFVELDESKGVMVVYDEHEDRWRFFSFPKMDYQWTACSFQPGLNPFTEV